MSLKRIAISAGHYPKRPGAVANTNSGFVYVEHELACKVVAALADELKKLELDVQEFRGTLSQKVEAINRWNADLALEIHFNHFDDPAVGGTETLYYAGSYFGKAISEVIQNLLVETIGTESRGAKVGWFLGEVGRPLYFLENTRMTAVITEVCFLNVDDIEKVIGIPERENWFEDVAIGIANGILTYIQNPVNLPEDTEEVFSNVVTDEAVAITAPLIANIQISEIELMQQCARFKDYRYRDNNSHSVLYPIPVKVGDRMIQGISHTPKLDCSTFVESFIIGGFQRLLGDSITLSEQQHRQLMIINHEDKPDGPIHTFEELGLGKSFSKIEDGRYKKITPSQLKGELGWSVFQGWHSTDSGHIFLIYKSKLIDQKMKHLILECNKSFNLNGVGVRNFGNFDTERFSQILTGDVPDQYWVDSDYLLNNYSELYGVKLNSIII